MGIVSMSGVGHITSPPLLPPPMPLLGVARIQSKYPRPQHTLRALHLFSCFQPYLIPLALPLSQRARSMFSPYDGIDGWANYSQCLALSGVREVWTMGDGCKTCVHLWSPDENSMRGRTHSRARGVVWCGDCVQAAAISAASIVVSVGRLGGRYHASLPRSLSRSLPTGGPKVNYVCW